MSKTCFKWAFSSDANLREPITEPAQKGWQQRDIPKASNMNWIFKQISDDINTLKKDIEKNTEELRNIIAGQQSELKTHQEILQLISNQQNSLNDEHNKLKESTKNKFCKAFRDNRFNLGITSPPRIIQLLERIELKSIS